MELLVVIAIIGVLAALLLPALTRGKARAQRIQCIGNLKELGTAFHVFAHDHHGRFPMQVPKDEGGSEEFVQAGNGINGDFYFSYHHFQTLANELVVPKILACPADPGRQSAATFGLLQNSNISYFVGANANYDVPLSILAGDRNITNDFSHFSSVVRGAYGLRWTSELHFFKGNVLFADAHVEELNNARVDLPASTAGNTTFFLPTVKPPGGSSPASPASGNAAAQTPASGEGQYQLVAAPVRDTGGSNAPAPPSPAPMPTRGVMANLKSGNQNFSPDTTVIEQKARETNDVAAVHDVGPTAAAPAADREEDSPLVWLLGAARGLVEKASWWFLLLLLILVGTALYFYARRRMREQSKR